MKRTSRPLRGVFVTGTDTGIGKTVVASALMHRYRGLLPVRYWKPIQTGIERHDDSREVRRLGACTPDEVLSDGVRLRRPVSPHLAARLNGEKIDLQRLLDTIAAQPPSQRWIVEGAGGVLVPINASELMIDLIVGLGLPVVVVARAKLGTINHTLLTLEALRARAVRVAGVVLVGPPNTDHHQAIESYGRVRVIGDLPRLAPLTPGRLRHWAPSLDVDEHVLELIR